MEQQEWVEVFLMRIMDKARRENVPQILIVDDEAGVRHVIRRVIHKYFSRCRIVEASDGVEAAQKLLSVNPQLVILDLGLPGISGLNICELIQDQPQHAHTYVLAITGLGTSDIQEQVFTRGVSEFLRKPFSVEELAQSIDRLLAQAI